MKSLASLAILALGGLAGCTESFDQPIPIGTQGHAVRANMMAQIIDTAPPQRRSQITNAQRPATAVARYRTDKVKPPPQVSTAGEAVAPAATQDAPSLGPSLGAQ